MSHRIFHAKIAGVTHEQNGVNPQHLLRRCQSGQELELIRDPRNKYDKNAIRACLYPVSSSAGSTGSLPRNSRNSSTGGPEFQRRSPK